MTYLQINNIINIPTFNTSIYDARYNTLKHNIKFDMSDYDIEPEIVKSLKNKDILRLIRSQNHDKLYKMPYNDMNVNDHGYEYNEVRILRQNNYNTLSAELITKENKDKTRDDENCNSNTSEDSLHPNNSTSDKDCKYISIKGYNKKNVDLKIITLHTNKACYYSKDKDFNTFKTIKTFHFPDDNNNHYTTCKSLDLYDNSWLIFFTITGTFFSITFIVSIIVFCIILCSFYRSKILFHYDYIKDLLCCNSSDYDEMEDDESV